MNHDYLLDGAAVFLFAAAEIGMCLECVVPYLRMTF